MPQFGSSTSSHPDQADLIGVSYSWDVPQTLKPLSDNILARVRSSGAGADLLAPQSVLQAARRMGSSASKAPTLGGAGASWFRQRAPVSVVSAAKGMGMMVRGTAEAAAAASSATSFEQQQQQQALQEHAFSVTLPPPYRVLLLLALALGCWWANVRGLRSLGLQVVPSATATVSVTAATVGAAASTAPRTSAIERKLLFAAVLCLGWAVAGWAAFRIYVAGGGDAKGRHAQALQGISFGGALIVCVWPGDLLARSMRAAFGRHLLHILTPSLKRGPTFPDVLLADILTSFAKVLGDVWLTACFLMPRKNHHEWWNGRGSLMVPFLASLPYAIRLRQCIAEYLVSTPIPGAALGSGGRKRARRPLANAAKYASAFPVIWLSALQSSTMGSESSPEGVPGVYNLWLLAVFVNSIFSFWWDVTNDWGLDLLRPSAWGTFASSTPELPSSSSFAAAQPRSEGSEKGSYHKRGLSSLPVGAVAAPIGSSSRTADSEEEEPGMPSSSSSASLLKPSNARQFTTPTQGVSHKREPSVLLRTSSPMLFPIWCYQGAVVLDLILRFTWSLKLSSHLHHVVDIEAGVFFLEALEILRRTAWVYLRVEWEHVKTRAWDRELRNGEAGIALT